MSILDLWKQPYTAKKKVLAFLASIGFSIAAGAITLVILSILFSGNADVETTAALIGRLSVNVAELTFLILMMINMAIFGVKEMLDAVKKKRFSR